ncbi:polyprenyl synthetase family protein [Bacteroidia bacterium]|jgi:octaprenyl-diphosphate synthase|nr:polyprenyl synthetase family protein [Bacteroidota bacterium]MDA8930827.1 polyprenyl synthetase family protein [Bacteroidia bacterium]MDB4174409.1 polyprenyl synthetase family protein [Bacteroidia bacterium]
MTSPLAYIKSPIEQELKVFEDRFKQSVKSKVPLLDTIMGYIVKRKGKQMRPLLVLHCAKLFGEINEATYRGAALVELLHTATLVHDDVVDEANMRRGFFSINALWKNKVAVLVGDYLLSKGLLLSLRNKDFKALEILSSAVEQMSEGELLQMEKARKLDITEQVYFDIITKKTASLLASCCGIGANSTNQDEDTLNDIIAMGNAVGIAFQIKDDLFDYGDNKVGKPTGIDIIEKKMTLPLIYALNTAAKEKRRAVIRIIKKDKKTKKQVNEVIAFVKEMGGLEYAQKRMLEYKADAEKLLSGIPGDGDTSYIAALIDYVIERKK